MKKTFQIISINLFLFVIILGLLEFSVRLFSPQIQFPGTDTQLIKEDAFKSTAGLNPNSSGISNGVIKTVNELGFWQYSVKSDSLSKKHLFLGDSVTMGIGVKNDSTFAGRINSLNTNILNSSLIGHSSSDYRNIIQTLIIDQKNSLGISSVTLFWCLNDVYENYGGLEAPSFESNSLINQIVSFFRSHFKLYHLLKSTFTDRPKTYYEFDRQFYRPENLSFIKAMDNLIAIHSLLKKEGISFTVALLPYEYQLRIDSITIYNPQVLLSDYLYEASIPTLDLSPFLLKTDLAPKELYLFGDGIHFSNQGHRVISEILIEQLFRP